MKVSNIRPISLGFAAAERATGLSVTTLKRLVKNGDISSRLIRNRRLILYDDLEEYIRSGKEMSDSGK